MPNPNPRQSGRPAWAELSRALRAAHGLAQTDWAAWLEVSRKTVQRWEQGHAVPDDRVELRLIEYCSERQVFARIARGVIDIGITSESELRDVIAAARLGRHNEGETETNIFGRAADLRDLREALDHHRLVTVVGVGGVGKTTVALEVADREDPVVRLDAIRDPDLVLAALATQLGVTERGGGSLRDRIVAVVDQHPRRILLDNFEHLLEAAPIIADLLDSCEKARFLITSRAPLRVGREFVIRLEPLTTSGIDSAAVQMFVARARNADQTRTFTDDDLEAARRICDRLDGLPLALELAAARLRYLSLEELETRLGSARILADGPRDATPRHQSLQQALAWSYELLTEPQRDLMAALRMFTDGATLATLEEIKGEDLVDDLGALVEHSLVVRAEGRYRMLRVVREHMVTLLPADCQESPMEWALGFAQREASRARGPEQSEALRQLTVEHANLREALANAIDRRDPRALDLALALCPLWDARSLLHEARRNLELASPIPGTDLVAVNAARVWIGYFAAHQGDLAVAQRLATDALEYFSAEGVDLGIGYARLVRGYVAAEQERLDDAANEWRASLDALLLAGDEWGVIRPLNNLGELARALRQLDEALALHEDALSRCRALGERGSLPAVLCAIAQVQLDRGDAAAARVAAAEALDVAQDLENVVGEATALEALGRVDYETDQLEAAVTHWALAATRRERVGLQIERRDRDRYHRQLAEARIRLGETRATVLWNEALASPVAPSNRDPR